VSWFTDATTRRAGDRRGRASFCNRWKLLKKYHEIKGRLIPAVVACMWGRRGAALVTFTVTATAISMAPAAPRAPRVQRVSGAVERLVHAQGPCRGGAAITREDMSEWQAKDQRVPLGQTTFTVFAGDRRVGKPVMRFKTDRAGRFDVRLPEGVFCVMAGEHGAASPETAAPLPRPTDPYVDADCLRGLAEACDAQLHVRKDGGREVKLTLHTFTPCAQPWAQPCYRGPMPP
jgi:hypothetical protein